MGRSRLRANPRRREVHLRRTSSVNRWQASNGAQEEVKEAKSVTILIKGPNPHTITQIKEAVRDGLRSVYNMIVDGSVVPGAGAFQVACAAHLRSEAFSKKLKGKTKWGVQAFADALLVI